MTTTKMPEPTDEQLLKFLDEEIPGWKDKTADEIRGDLFKMIDDLLDTYNLLKKTVDDTSSQPQV